jgi:DNA-binding response OmpR family regulator
MAVGATTSIWIRISSGQFMRILIIDDDDVSRELLCNTLMNSGHDVFELGSAMGAARLIFEKEIDAIVVDINLPDLNGDKLVRVLRQNARGQALGIVLVSSLPLDQLKAFGAASQADAVVSKSNIRSSLERAVVEACRRRVAP